MYLFCVLLIKSIFPPAADRRPKNQAIENFDFALRAAHLRSSEILLLYLWRYIRLCILYCFCFMVEDCERVIFGDYFSMRAHALCSDKNFHFFFFSFCIICVSFAFFCFEPERAVKMGIVLFWVSRAILLHYSDPMIA